MSDEGDIGQVSTTEKGCVGEAEWRISDFSSLSDEDNAFYGSPDFSLGGHKWSFSIFPNGWSVKNSCGFIQLVLRKVDSSPRTDTLHFSVSLRHVNGHKECEQKCSRPFKERSLNAFPPSLSRAELLRRRREFLPSDVLTVVFTLNGGSSATGASNSSRAECCLCKEHYDSESIASHQKSCVQRTIQCPSCLDDVLLRQWIDGHECQKEKTEEEEKLKENCGRICAETSTQTEEENGEKELQENCGRTDTEASTQTEEENGEKELQENCGRTDTEASTQTEEENEEKEPQENCGRTYTEASTQTEEENEAVKEPTAAEVSRVLPPYVTESDLPETSDSNQISATGIKATVEPINLPEERDLVTAISDFWNDGRGVDVTFELETPGGKTTFSAHRLVLALKSAYFADEFYSQGRNKEHRVIPLEGINPKAFEQMIRHCYDFEPCLETTEDICALFHVAYKFHVTSLINLCRTYFKDNKVVPGNVFGVLEVSKQLEDERVCDMCYKILEEKTKEVIAAYELRDISPNMVRAVLDLPKLSLNSEYELIHWIFEWTKVKTGDKDSTCKNRRQYLEKFLQNMDFLSLTTEEFFRLCKENPNFFSSEEIASISLNIAFPGSRDMPSWYDKELVLPRQRFAIYSKLCQGSTVSSKFCRVYTGNNE